MRKFFYLTLFFIYSPTFIKAQDVRQGLIVVHVDPAGKGEFKQMIYCYHFLNGSYTGREELITVAGKKEGKDYIRTDLGSNTLYKDRYLITGIGNIIDLKEKKILWDGRATLIRVSNDSAIYYTNDAFKGKYYSVYNFKTNTYGEVKNLVFKAKVGQDVEFDKTTTPIKLFFYPQSKPKVELVHDAGYGQQGTKDGRVPDPPMWWIDANNFVYGNFNKENTELAFYKVNVESKSSTLIGKAPIKPDPNPASISILDPKKVLVNLGSKQLLVDVNAPSATELVFSAPSNGFTYEVKTASYGRLIKLNEKDVGKAHFQSKTFKTQNNIAAMVKEIVMGTESYQQGLGVYNFNKQAFQTVDSEDVLTLVGFIAE
jgi:hypothetical protein